MSRTPLARASMLALITALGSASVAMAQSASDVFMDEVVTTATKSADVETVQDVAVAVTALNSDTLEALKVRDLEQLAFAAPNVQLDDIGTTRGTANFSIRGLGVNSSIPSIDPTVGVFVDGIYLGVNTGVVFDIFDLESVEVLRGPQGLLFGRNTTGGVYQNRTTRR
ncbi:MAG: Plug domain-containing protein, partial [Pseudomonadota bacterium]